VFAPAKGQALHGAFVNDVFIHPQALVETTDIGAGTRVWAFSHVMDKVKIGKECNIGDHSFVEAGAVIGDRCTIKNGNMIWEGVTLEEGVFVGPHVFFTNDLHPRSPRLAEAHGRYAEKKNWLRETHVLRGAALGAGSVILAGTTIGRFAMIGAGAIVTKSVKDFALVTGNPARFAGWVCRCGEGLKIRARASQCKVCGTQYKLTKDGLRDSDTHKSK
jgi:UDP-2-acetamido-3-amino-2,3-dideoxy-glucuronate N-acetyltransferase